MPLRPPSPVLFALLVAAAFAPGSSAGAATPAAAERPVSFNRDIRPIMSDTCFHCHGFDANTRKEGLRLDLREEALKPTKNGVIPIVPGKPDESEIILRLEDALDPMPPADAHKTLTPAQKALLRRWVAEGAVYEPHWAYAALARPAVPTPPPSRDARIEPPVNPIDAFIRARLAEKNIAPSAPAAPAQLIRRLSLDLTGLPPTPAEVAAFEAASATDPRAAYDQLVARLFASPHHGERLAVWWLDIARFADTVGFHGDQNQRIFPYRDYVINAFNANKRFDRFTIEQLAGDLLPKPTTEQRVATGYNRLNMMTREGGAQPKEYLYKYGAERVRSVAAAWFGSTFGCAECHDHKFDPIKSRDFYELQSFFADLRQWGVYSDYVYTPNPDLDGFTNDHPFPPELEVESPYLRAQKEESEAALAALRTSAAARLAAGEPASRYEAWLAGARAFLAAHPSGWQKHCPTPAVLRANRPVADARLSVSEDGTVHLENDLRRGDSLRLVVDPPAAAAPIAAVRLEFASGVPARGGKRDANRGTVRLALSVRGADGKDRRLDVAFAEANLKEERYSGGQEILGIASGWKLPADSDRRPFTGIWVLARPVVLAPGEQLVLAVTGDHVPPFRVATSPLAAVDPLQVGPALVADAAPAGLRAETFLLASPFDADAARAHHTLAARIRDTRGGRTKTLVSESVPTPIEVRVLARGNWLDETGPLVQPATPSFLPDRRESTENRRLTRLDLAQYIVSEANPLTARTVANRLWAMFFGTGLSAVIDDFGSQGEAPSHPELLDWLAVELRSSGWDLRHLMRLIVSSATYRQDSNLRPGLRDLDPANRLLASQNPRRLEAEFVRDQALHVAGALDLRHIGGPSVKPYQPDGYYDALQFPDRRYVASDADGQWRRGVYMHWQRTFLHPMLANFDAPSRDECAAQRVVSNTPQQALTLLNDPTFVEAARLLAARLLREAATDDTRLTLAFRLALARAPAPAEADGLRRFLAAQSTHFAANGADAEKLLALGLAPRPAGDPAELAAWTSLARVLLNTHETLTRY